MYFITEVKPGETCVIKGYENEPLIIRDLDDHMLTTINPTGPWTHEKLTSLDLSHVNLTCGGDAFLGKQWIGSTEC